MLRASKYLRLLKLVSFIKVVRVAKVVAHTNQIEKKIENKNHKVGINIDSASIQSLMKKRTIRITNNYSLNEIALFLKYQSKKISEFLVNQFYFYRKKKKYKKFFLKFNLIYPIKINHRQSLSEFSFNAQSKSIRKKPKQIRLIASLLEKNK